MDGKIVTEIRVDTARVFEAACRRTLEAVKAAPGVSPDAALSEDELPWAADRMREARDRVARLLCRLSKRIDEMPQAEQEDEELVFRVVCGTPVQEGLLEEAGTCQVLPSPEAPHAEQRDPITLVPMGAARLRISAFPQTD